MTNTTNTTADLLKKLDETYAAIDRELRTYSDKSNAHDPSARRHYDEAERLRGKAHALTAKLCGR